MRPEALLGALDLPPESLLDYRVPKKLLLEKAPTAADKRVITAGVEELHWLATLKPGTIGVPPYSDDVREYLEIAVVSATLRDGAKTGRLAELIHRAIPYPVLLLCTQGERLTLSLAHKRRSQGEAGATVLDGDLVNVELSGPFTSEFASAIALGQQPRTHLFALYQCWIEKLIALLAARITGTFALPVTPKETSTRWESVQACAALDVAIARLRAAAVRERQLARQVELNLEVKRLERERAALLDKL